MFKKFIPAIITVIIGAIIFCGFSISYAQTTSTTALSLANLLPSDTTIYVELNTSNETFLTDLILTNLSEEFIYDESADVQLLIQDIFKNNLFSLAVSEINPQTSMDQPIITASFQISDSNFSDFLELSGNADLVESDYEGIATYSEEPDKFLAVLNNLLVITSSEKSLHSIIDNFLLAENGEPSSNSLSANSEFINGAKKALPDNFLTAYLSLSFLNEIESSSMILPAGNFNQAIIEGFKSEFISVAQTEDGYKASIYLETDDEKLAEIGFVPQDLSFIPELYKKINGNKVLFFAESSGLEKSIEYLNQLAPEANLYDELETAIESAIQMSFKNDFLPLLEGKYTFAVHDNGTALPSFTMIFDVEGNKRKANLIVEALNLKLENYIAELEKELEADFHTASSIKVGNTSFYTHIFDMSATGMPLGIPMSEANEVKKLYLYFGVTDDSKIVISTSPKIGNAYNEIGNGMLSDDLFNANFNEAGKTITGINFLNFDNINNYVQNLIVSTDDSTDDYTAEIKQSIQNFMGPWHSLYSSGTAQKGSITATMNINLDVNGFENYGELFSNLMFEAGDLIDETRMNMPDGVLGEKLGELGNFPMLGGMGKNFNDVSMDDWHYFYIEDLTEKGIISGYDDGTFLPNKPITRAEFTKLAVESSRMAELFFDSAIVTDPSHFKDINGDEWFSSYIAIAYNHNLVNGDPDGNFRPSDPITRAEAVQILYNISGEDYQGLTGDEPFSDVQEWNWYWNAVSASYNANIVSGKDALNFAPADNLTRAEAAKIISNFLYYHLL